MAIPGGVVLFAGRQRYGSSRGANQPEKIRLFLWVSVISLACAMAMARLTGSVVAAR